MQRCGNDIAVEIGTYYAGWTAVMSQNFKQVITLQSIMPTHLEHFDKTQKDQQGRERPLAEHARRIVPEQYHGSYDFNYLTQQLTQLTNVTCMLASSPPTMPWLHSYDLCTIDVTHDPLVNLQHYQFWKQHGKANAIMLIGTYGWRTNGARQLLDNIAEPYEILGPNDNYVAVML